ncbi:MAG TPA: hypothetical protein VFS31_17515, partial [Chitinophagaceae bacterium]|nr:hypothetical protein [Chitinophagaceae bacterium]
MKIRFTLLLLLHVLCAAAQTHTLPLSVSIFNNGTALPGQGYLGVFSTTPHPGICVGTYHLYRERKHSELFQSLKLGYFYHRHAQQGIQLYTETGYRYLSSSGVYGEGAIGAGYLHSFAGVEQF